jgi:hypothetical protein
VVFLDLGPSRFLRGYAWKNQIVIQRLVLCQSLGKFHVFSAFSTFHQFTDFYLVVRSQKSVGLVGGSPTYDIVEVYQSPGATAGTYQYNPDGMLFALAMPPGCVELRRLWICVPYASVPVHQAETAVLLHDLTIPDVVELSFLHMGHICLPGNVMSSSERKK